MIRRFCGRTRHVTVWIAVLALSVLPFVHVHAGGAWSHAGDHAHPPVVHTIFASDEAAHPPEEPEFPASGTARAVSSHDLGHEIDSGSGVMAPPMVFGVLPPAGMLPSVTSTGQPAPAGTSPSAGVLDISTAPRAPPVSSLS